VAEIYDRPKLAQVKPSRSLAVVRLLFFDSTKTLKVFICFYQVPHVIPESAAADIGYPVTFSNNVTLSGFSGFVDSVATTRRGESSLRDFF
jgi:hypothetical protein